LKIVYLNETDPNPDRDGRWILLDGGGDGNFYGTGFGYRDGEEKIYISDSENDSSIEKAISAATSWAKKSGVDVIYVRENGFK
jgi:hypothetical protein